MTATVKRNWADLAHAVGIHPRHTLGRDWAGGPPSAPSIGEVLDILDLRRLDPSDYSAYHQARAAAFGRGLWTRDQVYAAVNRALGGVNLALSTNPKYCWQTDWLIKAAEPGAWAWAAREIVLNSTLFQDEGHISDMARKDYEAMPPHVFVEDYIDLLKNISAVCPPRYDDDWYVYHVMQLNWSDPSKAVYVPRLDKVSGRIKRDRRAS